MSVKDAKQNNVQDLDSLMKETSNATRCGRLKKIGEIVGIELAVGTKGPFIRIRVHCMVNSKALHQKQDVNLLLSCTFDATASKTS